MPEGGLLRRSHRIPWFVSHTSMALACCGCSHRLEQWGPCGNVEARLSQTQRCDLASVDRGQGCSNIRQGTAGPPHGTARPGVSMLGQPGSAVAPAPFSSPRSQLSLWKGRGSCRQSHTQLRS